MNAQAVSHPIAAARDGATPRAWLRPFLPALRVAYRGWMVFASVLATAMTYVMLTVVYVLVVGPTFVLSRIAGKDLLGLSIDRARPSHWIERSSGPLAPRHLKQY